MCGLIGGITSKAVGKNKLGQFIRDGLLCDSLRGYDSTGIFAVPKLEKDPIYVNKKDVAGYDYVQLDKFKQFMHTVNDYKFIIGHNRWATVGGVSMDTAHPFQHGNITLVHNGTLKNHRALGTNTSYATDSETICAAINELGIVEVAKKMDGAFTLIWHDERTDNLHIIRNKERPLYIATTKDETTILFASEKGMLEWLGERNGYELHEPILLTENVLYTFSSEAVSIDLQTDTLEVYIAPKPKPYQYNNYNNNKHTSNLYLTKGEASKSVYLTKEEKVYITLIDKTIGAYEDIVVKEWVPYSSNVGAIGKVICSGYDDPDVCYVGHAKRKDEFAVGEVLTAQISNVATIDKKMSILIGDVYSTGFSKKEFDDMYTLVKENRKTKKEEGSKVGKEEEKEEKDNSTNTALEIALVKAEKEKKEKEKEKEMANTELAESAVVGPNGTTLTVIEYSDLTMDGCSMCATPLYIKDADSILWVGEEQAPLCAKCGDMWEYNDGNNGYVYDAEELNHIKAQDIYVA